MKKNIIIKIICIILYFILVGVLLLLNNEMKKIYENTDLFNKICFSVASVFLGIWFISFIVKGIACGWLKRKTKLNNSNNVMFQISKMIIFYLIHNVVRNLFLCIASISLGATILTTSGDKYLVYMSILVTIILSVTTLGNSVISIKDKTSFYISRFEYFKQLTGNFNSSDDSFNIEEMEKTLIGNIYNSSNYKEYRKSINKYIDYITNDIIE